MLDCVHVQFANLSGRVAQNRSSACSMKKNQNILEPNVEKSIMVRTDCWSPHGVLPAGVDGLGVHLVHYPRSLHTCIVPLPQILCERIFLSLFLSQAFALTDATLRLFAYDAVPTRYAIWVLPCCACL